MRTSPTSTRWCFGWWKAVDPSTLLARACRVSDDHFESTKKRKQRSTDKGTRQRPMSPTVSLALFASTWWWWLFLVSRNFWESLGDLLSAYAFFYNLKKKKKKWRKNGDQLAHTNSTLEASIGPNWLKDTR